MFAGGAGAAGIGAVGLLPPLPPPHATNDTIAVAIAGRFIVPPNQGAIK